jgi:hypothetical protein
MASDDTKWNVKVIEEKEKIPTDNTTKGGETVDSVSGKRKARRGTRRSSTTTATLPLLRTRTLTTPLHRKRRSNTITLKRLLIILAFLTIQMHIFSLSL